MSQTLITLPELAIAISQLPNCHHELKSQIEIPIAERRRANVSAYERPPIIIFNRVAVQEPFNSIEYRWALSGEYNILI
jgi:hypothetical protein